MSLLNDLVKEGESINSNFNKYALDKINELEIVNKAHNNAQVNIKILADIHHSQIVWRDQWLAITLHKPYASLIIVDELMVGAIIARAMQENFVFIDRLFKQEIGDTYAKDFLINSDEFIKRLNEYLDVDDSSIKHKYRKPIIEVQKHIESDFKERKFYKLCSYIAHVSPKLVEGLATKRQEDLKKIIGMQIENYYLSSKKMLYENV